MNHLSNSKWTSVKRLNGWKHYEVLNVFKNRREVEMFCVCERSKKVRVPLKDLVDKTKWIRGWEMKMIF